MLRKAGERTVSGLWSLIGKLVDMFLPQECANYFKSRGYDPDRKEFTLIKPVYAGGDPDLDIRGPFVVTNFVQSFISPTETDASCVGIAQAKGH